MKIFKNVVDLLLLTPSNPKSKCTVYFSVPSERQKQCNAITKKSVRFEMTRPRLQARARPYSSKPAQQNAASIPDGDIRHTIW